MKHFVPPFVKRALPILTIITTASQNLDAQQVSGKIFHDIYANALDGGETIGDGNNTGLNNVTVRIFADNGNGIFDAGDNVMVTNGSTTTNGSGSFTLPTSGTNLSNGTYWVIAYSQTITPNSFNGTYTASNTWMEQTYGSGGAWGGNLRADGSGGTAVMTGNGRCFAGKTGDKSDIITNTNTPTSAQIILAEHVAKITISGASVSNINMGFSLNAVTNTEENDQLASDARFAQGSLRQFINNANAFAGGNSMVFVPAVTTNAGSGSNRWWSITLGNVLPVIEDDYTVFEGKAYSPDNGSLLDNNSGTATGAPTGVVGAGADGIEASGDEAMLPSYYRPELEINANNQTAASSGTILLANTSWNISVDGFTCYRMSFYNNPAADACCIYTSANATGVNQQTLIQECFFGVRADGSAAMVGTQSNTGLCISNKSSGSVKKCLFNGLDYTGMFIPGTCTAEYNAVLNCGSASYNCGDGITVENHMGSGSMAVNPKYIQYNYIQYCASYGMECWNIPGVSYIRNNTIQNSGVQGNCDGSGIYNEDSGIRLFGDNNVVEYNVIKNNPGSGIVVVNESSSNSINNRISKNVIYKNGRLSLDYQPFNSVKNPNGNGVTPNNGLYGGGVNKGMDYPIFTVVAISGSSMYIKGYVGSAPDQSTFAGAIVEVYKADNDGNNDGEAVEGDGLSKPHGEGRYYLGSTTTDANGNFEASMTINPALVITGDNLTGTATINNNTSEFGVTYITPIQVLAVTLGNFTAYETNKGVVIKWTTLKEINNGYFTIEKSNDGINWQPVTIIRTPGSNSDMARNYESLDEKPYNGNNYYRLKITDANMKIDYSKIVKVVHKGYSAQDIYPNPFNSNIKMKIYSLTQQPVTITISDIQGRQLKQFNMELKSGENNFTLDNLEGLKPGTYFIQGKNENFKFSERMIKL
jgi:Secretion system C-terminal sorting domain